MGDDSDWQNLPTDQKIEHKAWKARVQGYTELLKLCEMQDDPKSPEFNKFLGSMKKIVADSNAIAQEKGLEAVLSYVTNAANAGKAANDICSGLVNKCINSSRAKTRELAVDIALMLIEIEKQDVVQEEFLTGTQNKQPKIVTGCVLTLRQALHQFGPKVITLKPLIKEFGRLLEDRDKGVRDETKLLIVEVYRWIGTALKPQLANLKPVQVTELEADFANIVPGTAQPERYFRSLQAKMAAAGPPRGDTEAAASGPGGAVAAPEAAIPIDPLEFVDPVEILSKIPKDFFTNMESSKWQERREALEVLEKLTNTPKLLPGDYGDVMRVLLKTITKDSNIMLVILAAKIATGMAKALRKDFHPYAMAFVRACLEKFKEKKPNVVTVLRDCIDAAYQNLTIEVIAEDVVEALGNKNPAIKAEAALFICRCFQKCPPGLSVLNKKLLKQYIPVLATTMIDTVPEVREASYQALGIAMKIVGEKVFMPFLGEVDNIKMKKVKDYYDEANNATVAAPAAVGAVTTQATPPKPAGATVTRPSTAPAANADGATAGNAPAATGGARPATAKPSTAKPGAASGAKKPPAVKGGKGAAQASAADSLPTESLMSDEAVEDKIKGMFGEECWKQMSDANWKERLAAMETLQRATKRLVGDEIPCQALIRFFAGNKPGLKDNNFQVLKQKLEMVVYLAANATFTRTAADICLPDVFDKVGDAKVNEAAKNALTAMAEACTLEYVGLQLAQATFKMKSPKNQSEALSWLSNAIKEFGLKLSVKELIKYIRVAFGATNPTVRQAAISLTATVYLYMGDTLRTLLDDEKPALLQLIDAEIEKVRNEKPPAPTRTFKYGPKPGGAGGQANEAQEAEEAAPQEEEDIVPRMNIMDKLSSDVFDLLTSKNWKERNEGLEKVQTALRECKFIQGQMHELVVTLSKLCSDPNKNLVRTNLNLCDALIKATPKVDMKNYCKAYCAGFLVPMSDNKPQIRTVAISAMDTLADQCGLVCIFELEVFIESLAQENPFVRSEVCGWLAKQLNNSLRSGQLKRSQMTAIAQLLVPLLTHLYACLEDRSADVRKNAQETLLPLMQFLGYETMVKTCNKVCPQSKAVRPLLDKTKEALPAAPPVQMKAPQPVPSQAPPEIAQTTKKAEPPPNKKKPASSVTASTEEKSERSETAASTSKPAGKAGAAASKSGLNQSKKAASVDSVVMSPLSATSPKEQRFNDEKKRKLLKWDFEAPQKEHIQQLSNLFQPVCSPDLHALLFSTDFRQHVKALDLLMKFIDSDTDLVATRANFDLILKWCVLRFFETNPTVIIRELEYLNKVLQILGSQSYSLHELEASSFLPYLVTKLGDPKDNIRRDVRSIFLRLRQIYSVNKLFPHLMEGLRSKVSRQRQECLEELGLLISCYDLGVCQPNPTQAFRVIAQQISDRDSGVRTAALNTLVEGYNIIGEQIIKLLGNLSEKDSSMLWERIKRIGNFRGTSENASGGDNMANSNSALNTATVARGRGPGRASELPQSQSTDAISSLATGRNAAEEKMDDIPPAFRLDFDDSDLQASRIKLQRPLQLADVSTLMKEIMKPFEMPKVRTSLKTPSAQAIRQSVDATSAISMVITQITSKDLIISFDALAQIDQVLQKDDIRELILDHVDQLLLSITMQILATPSKYMEKETEQELVNQLLKALLATLLSLFTQELIAKEVRRDRLKDLLQALFKTMLDDRIVRLSQGEQFVLSFNVMVTKILEHSDKTAALSALLQLLYECVEGGSYGSKLTQLVMKCLWRITRSMRIPGVVEEYQLDVILQDCHTFFKSFPSSSWKNRKPDVPLRTVKTLLHTLCQQKGEGMLQIAKRIKDKEEESEVYSYVAKTLKALSGNAGENQESMVNMDDLSKSQTPMTPIGKGAKDANMAALLSGHSDPNDESQLKRIFKDLNTDDQWKAAFEKLYDYREAHPDADLSPYVNMNKPYFSKFIEIGLNRVAIERKRHMVRQSCKNDLQRTQRLTVNGKVSEQELTAKYFTDRLEAIKKEFNFYPASVLKDRFALQQITASQYQAEHGMDITAQSMITSVALGGLPDTSALDFSWVAAGDSVEGTESSPQVKTQLTGAEIDELKRRLERIKNVNK